MSHGDSQRIHFFKMTGTGNDFIIIDNRSKRIDSDNCREFVRSACRRKLSAGADGVILIENDPEVDFKWRFFNADASEAEMCGNGSRCAARFVHLTGIVKNKNMSFRTLAGIIRAEILDGRVKVQMTPPHDLHLGVHVDVDGRPFDLDYVNTGVPHAISFVADAQELESVDIERWGRAIRFHPRFQPAGTNVNFVLVHGPQHISVRTYERGVEGETLACGTGAIASSLIAAAKGGVSSPVKVTVRSGESLTVHFHRPPFRKSDNTMEFEEVYLEGEARVVYEADLWDETLFR